MSSAEETGGAESTEGSEFEISADNRRTVAQLCEDAFGADRLTIGRLTDVNRGRGAFSIVLRVRLTDTNPTSGPVPETVVAKLPVDGPNGEAAVAGGAYAREALAYRSVVGRSPVRTPRLYAVQQPADGTCSLLLEDLGDYRVADQLEGLASSDALAVATSLQQLHSSWDDPARLADLPVRRNTVAGFAPEALQNGLQALESRWAAEVTEDQRKTFARLVHARQGLVDRFEVGRPTLCHGDPRADNLVFDDRFRTGDAASVILFDWQQLAVQFGEADLAWLAATSLTVPVRRGLDRAMVEAYGGDMDRYRLGFALPGLAVLMLAQRQFPTERARRFVAFSLDRIATAIDDLEVYSLG